MYLELKHDEPVRVIVSEKHEQATLFTWKDEKLIYFSYSLLFIDSETAAEGTQHLLR
jgi:hypothetical protein